MFFSLISFNALKLEQDNGFGLSDPAQFRQPASYKDQAKAIVTLLELITLKGVEDGI